MTQTWTFTPIDAGCKWAFLREYTVDCFAYDINLSDSSSMGLLVGEQPLTLL